MPLLFLISELVHSKYFDTAANSILFSLFNFYKFIRKQVMDTPKMVAAKDDITFKKVTFDGGEQSAFETDGASVLVVGSSGSHDHGSSKIKLKNIVDYKWEVKNYVGRLIAVHLDGKYVAYAIKVAGKKGSTEGMVRVANPTTGQRALIRGKTSEVLDLQFAHMKSQIMLASIEMTALHIHKIETINDNILCTLLVKVDDPVAGHVPRFDKVNWCPYVPENETESDSDAGKLLVWTRGNTFQCFNVGTVVDSYGIGTHHANDIIEGSLKFDEVSAITDASLSPDGTTLAITLEDGDIRFYQVYFHINEDEPRLLHQWTPHNKKPVSGLFFLDDHTKSAAGTSLWKYAITASDNNTEYKVWCCSSWECMQTIRFEAADGKPMFFKTEIDPTSAYLVLTDAKSRSLYVMQIMQSSEDEAKADNGQNSSNGTKPLAFIKSITEFPVQSPILSFGIVDATVRKFKCAYNDMYLLEELDDYEELEENANRYCVVIHLFLVQPKSVQECQVLYQPSLSGDTAVGSSVSALTDGSNHEEELSNDLASILNIKSSDDSSMSSKGPQIRALLDSSSTSGSEVTGVSKLSELTKTEKSSSSQSINKPSSALNLLTPDSFHSSGKITPEGVSNEVYSTLRMLAGEKPVDASQNPLLQLVNNKQSSDESDKAQLLQQVSEESNNENNPESGNNQIPLPPMPPTSMLTTGRVSGGSSPSREVQEILSQKGSDCINDFYSNSIDIQDDTDASGNNGDAADGNDEEKNSNQDDDETYTLNNVTEPADPSNNVQPKTDWPDAPTVMQTFNHSATPAGPINDINNKLDQLLEIIQTQNCQLSELRSEVADLKKSHSTPVIPAKPAQSAEVNTQKLELRLCRLIEEYLARYEREHSKRLETFLGARDTQIREIRDNLVIGLGPVLCSQLGAQLSQVFVSEFQKHLLPVVGARLDNIKAQIQAEIAQKLTITDKVIKENISNICKSKDTLDIFGRSVVNGVQAGLQQTYLDSMRSIILPAYEKANNELFKQLYETFNNGTIGYANQLANYTKMYEPIHNELVSLMRAVPDQLRNINESAVNMASHRNEITKDVKTMQVNLLKTLKENIKMEIKRGFETQAASLEDSVIMAVRSQAQTPAPSMFDVQEQIKSLLNQGQINKAFHQALLANDLHLVEYALERADYNKVFNPCPLEQTVLLSLIQQISADMSTHSDLKQKYLSDGIVNLDMRDPITKEHAPKVLKELVVNCQNYVSANPHSQLSSGVRMFILAVQGFGINFM